MSAESLASLRADALHILRGTLADCSIPAAMQRTLRCDGAILHRLRAEDRGGVPRSGAGPAQIELARFSRFFVVAIGKAACPMLDSLQAILPDGLPLRGVCAGPALPNHCRANIRYFAAGHPLPNADSFAAAQAALELLRDADEYTLVFFLISGGGSSLCELPLDSEITLDEARAFHQELIGCGASIAEINTIRRQFSAVKGGQLAHTAGQAAQFSLFISDVPTQHLEAIASGPTLPPRAGEKNVAEIFSRHQLLAAFPPAIRRFFEKQFQTDEASTALLAADASANAERRFHDLLLSSEDVAVAAQRRAHTLGYRAVIENGCDDWDAEDAARFLLQQLASFDARTERVCLISTGEVTVRLGSTRGRGGRNQHFALEMARLLGQARRDRSTVALSAGTDGIDGNSPAAGAIVDGETFARAALIGLDPDAALREHDAWPLFEALHDAIITGPTGNNLRDLRLLLSAS